MVEARCAPTASFEWVEIDAGHFRFVEEVAVGLGPGEACEGRPGPAVVLQHDLLRPTEGFVPGAVSEDFELARVGDHAARVGRFAPWSIEGGGALAAETVAEVLARVAGVLGTPIEVRSGPSRFTVRWGGPSAAWGRISRSIDPETGEILATDLFVNPRGIRQVRDALEAREQAASDLRPRAARARRWIEEGARARVAPPPASLARLRAAPVLGHAEQIERISSLSAEVQAALVSRDAALLLGEPQGPEWPTRTALDGLDGLDARTRSPSAQPDAAWYSDPGMQPEWAGWLAFDDGPDASRRLEQGLLEHVVLVGLLRAYGLEPNLAGSRDVLNFPPAFWRGGDLRYATSSVLDHLAPEARAVATSPRLYDVAALRWLYASEVAVVDAAQVGLSGLDVADLPVRLCGDCGGEEVAGLLAARAFVPEADAAGDRRLPFLHCGRELAIERSRANCEMGDLGPSARADMAMRRARWSLAYRHDPRVIGPHQDFFERAFTGVSALRAAAAAAEHLRQGRGHAADQYSAAVMGADLAALMLTTPRPGRYCPWPASEPRLYLIPYYLEDCDPFLDLDSPQARAQSQIEVEVGIARPAAPSIDGSGWAPGSALDAALAPWLLYEPAGRGAPAAALVDLFPDRLDALLSGLATQSPMLASRADIELLGTMWCAGDEARGSPRPRAWIADAPPCEAPSYLMPPVTRGRIQHVLVAATQLGRLGPRLEVYEMSEPAAATVDWARLPAGYCEVEDPVDGGVFRGVGLGSLACDLVDNAAVAVRTWREHGEPTPDWVRPSMAMLELAATLRR